MFEDFDQDNTNDKLDLSIIKDKLYHYTDEADSELETFDIYFNNMDHSNNSLSDYFFLGKGYYQNETGIQFRIVKNKTNYDGMLESVAVPISQEFESIREYYFQNTGKEIVILYPSQIKCESYKICGIAKHQVDWTYIDMSYEVNFYIFLKDGVDKYNLKALVRDGDLVCI